MTGKAIANVNSVRLLVVDLFFCGTRARYLAVDSEPKQIIKINEILHDKIQAVQTIDSFK